MSNGYMPNISISMDSRLKQTFLNLLNTSQGSRSVVEAKLNYKVDKLQKMLAQEDKLI